MIVNDTSNDTPTRSTSLEDSSDEVDPIRIARSQRQGRKLKQRSATTPRIAPQDDLLDWVPHAAPKDYGTAASMRTTRRPQAPPKDDLSSSTHSMRSFSSNGASDWIEEEEDELAIDSVHLTKRHRLPHDELSGSFHSIHSTKSNYSSNSLGWVEEDDELAIDSVHLTKRHRRPHKDELIGSSSSFHSLRSSLSVHELDWVEEDDELLIDSVHLTKSHVSASSYPEGLFDNGSSSVSKTATIRALLRYMESGDLDEEDNDEGYSSDAIL